MADTTMYPAEIAVALRNGTEPSRTHLIAYQQEAANYLACLQRSAYAKPCAATISHHWLYELYLPFVVCPDFDTPVILELETFVIGLTDA